MKLKPIKFKKIQHKKGIMDTIVMIVIMLVVVITLIVSVFIASQIQTALQPALSSDNVSQTAFNKGVNTAVGFGDWIFMVVFVVLIMGLIITSFMFYAHPIFAVLFIILSIGVIILAVIAANVYSDLTSRSAFTSTMTHFPMSDWIMKHLPLLMCGIVMLGVVIIYAKGASGGGGNYQQL